MPYQYNIPLATDQLSKSQGDIQGNFNALGSIAGNPNTSSASLNSTSGFNWVYLPSNGSIPPVASSFAAGQIGLYSATNPTTTFNELYINKTVGLPANPTVVQIPLTAFGNGTISGSPQTASSWTYFPSGMLMIGGKVTGSGNITITFNDSSTNGVSGFPGFQNFISSIQATRLDNTHPNNFACVATYSLTGCAVTLSNGGSGTIFWTVFGY